MLKPFKRAYLSSLPLRSEGPSVSEVTDLSEPKLRDIASGEKANGDPDRFTNLLIFLSGIIWGYLLRGNADRIKNLLLYLSKNKGLLLLLSLTTFSLRVIFESSRDEKNKIDKLPAKGLSPPVSDVGEKEGFESMNSPTILKEEREEQKIEIAKNSEEFENYRQYFSEEGYEIIGKRVTQVPTDDGENQFIVTFDIDDDNETTNAELNITLDEDSVVSAIASFDYYENGEIEKVESYRIVDGEVKKKE